MKSVKAMKPAAMAVLLFVTASLFVPVSGFTQFVVKGKVIDAESKKPIADVDVRIISWKKGDKTNASGQFEIKLPANASEGDMITVHFLANGYKNTSEFFYYKENPAVVNVSLTKSEFDGNANAFTTEIYKIRHRNPQQIFTLIEPFLTTDRSKATVSSRLKAITIKDRLSVHDKIKKIIWEYDVPLKKIWLEVTVIEASQNGAPRKKLPAELEKVVQKLSSLFKFNTYEIVSRGDAMGIEESTLTFSSSSSKSDIDNFHASATVGFFDDVIKLGGFRVSMRSGNKLTTSLNIKDGETVVVGSSRGQRDEERSLITVVTAKVVKE